jgi:hypothetical protein
MKNAVFWDVALCRSCVNRRFGGTYRLHLQDRKIRERGFPPDNDPLPALTPPLCNLLAWPSYPISTDPTPLLSIDFPCGSVCSHLLTLVPRSRIFLPWRWRRYVPPKRRFTQILHSTTSQKRAFFTSVLRSYLLEYGIFKILFGSQEQYKVKVAMGTSYFAVIVQKKTRNEQNADIRFTFTAVWTRKRI